MLKVIIGDQFPQIIIPAIENSRVSLDVVMYDWRWYPQDPGAITQKFNQAIVRAVRRGVRVRAIVNNNDIVNTLKSVGCQARKLPIKNLVHSKLMIIDSRFFVTGSHNYTQHAFTQNIELSLFGDDDVVVSELTQFFVRLFSMI